MTYGTNAAVAATVPLSAKHVDAALYSMAVRCDTYEEAYKLLRRIEHLLPLPLPQEMIIAALCWTMAL